MVPAKNEQEHIASLIRSVHDQDCRPVEVTVVDGGSIDGTLEILEKLKAELESEDFGIRVLREFGQNRSPANARNIGILHSNGEYVIFVDADRILTHRDFVRKVKEGLDENPWISVRAKPLIDTTLEKALVAEGMAWGDYVLLYCATRRSVFDKRLFDAKLGFAEDKDFFDDYLRREMGIQPKFVDAVVGRHEPHTLREFLNQQIWYGETVWLYVLKNCSSPSKKAIEIVVEPFRPVFPLVSCIAILIGTLVCVPSYVWLAMIPASYTLYRRIRFYRKIPKEHRSPITYMITTLVEWIIRPFAYGYGLLKGLLAMPGSRDFAR
nr:glycosyltransferase family A protein [Candidatus Njordarchaeum guaymaensis]